MYGASCENSAISSDNLAFVTTFVIGDVTSLSTTVLPHVRACITVVVISVSPAAKQIKDNQHPDRWCQRKSRRRQVSLLVIISTKINWYNEIKCKDTVPFMS